VRSAEMGRETDNLKKLISFIGVAAAVILCAAALMGGGWGTLPLLALWLASAFLLGWLVFKKLPAFSSDKWYLLIAGAFCVGLRVLALALFPVDTAPVHDFGTYFRLASYLAGDGALPRTSANLFPHILFFSMALSVPFRVFESTVLTYQLCGVALSLLSMVLLYGIMRGFAKKQMAFYGALLWAFSPTLILYAPLNCSEHLALMLTLLYIYLLFKTERRQIRSVPCLLLSGATLGLVLLALELVRPVSVILLLATLLYLPIRHWKSVKKRFLPVCGAALAAMLVLIGGKALALRAADGILPQPLAKSSYVFTLLAGSNTDAGGAWNEADSKLFLDTMKKTYVNGYDYQSAYDALNEVVLERYCEMSPSELCKLLLHKNETLWGEQRMVVSYLVQYRDAAQSSVLETHPRAVWLAGRFCDAGMIALLLLFAVACCGELRQKSETPLLWCITSVLGFVCLYCISEASGRYTATVYPMLYITAAPVVAAFFNRKETESHE